MEEFGACSSTLRTHHRCRTQQRHSQGSNVWGRVQEVTLGNRDRDNRHCTSLANSSQVLLHVLPRAVTEWRCGSQPFRRRIMLTFVDWVAAIV